MSCGQRTCLCPTNKPCSHRAVPSLQWCAPRGEIGAALPPPRVFSHPYKNPQYAAASLCLADDRIIYFKEQSCYY